MSSTANVYITKAEMHERIRKIPKDAGSGGVCFIFGAGASYGYTENRLTEYLPPTVTDLFDLNNKTVYDIIHKEEHAHILRQREFLLEDLANYDNDLEKYLKHLYETNNEDDTFPLLLLYLHDIYSLASSNFSDTENNYMKLIYVLSGLRGKLPWSCVSFNYDTILEQSFISSGRDRTRVFDSLEDYTDINPKILKPHGSVNFKYYYKERGSGSIKGDRDIFGFMMAGKSDLGKKGLISSPLHTNFTFYNESKEWDASASIYQRIDEYVIPMIMVPIHGTHEPQNIFFKNTLDKAQEEIKNASLVIAIGYNFGDELFAGRLRELDLSKKDLILVGTNTRADPTQHRGYKNAENIWDSKNIRVFKGMGIKDFADSIIKKPSTR